MVRLRSVSCVLACLVVLCITRVPGPADGTSSSEDEGLCSSIGLQQKSFRVGDQLVVTLTVKNVSDKTVRFYFPDIYKADFLQIRTGDGEEIKGQISAVYGPATSDCVHLLQPGAVYETQIRGRFLLEFVRASLPTSKATRAIILDFGDVVFSPMHPGDFALSFRYPSEGFGKGYGMYPADDSVWKAKLSSGAVPFSLRMMTREKLDRNLGLLRSGSAEEKSQAAKVAGANHDRQAAPALLDLLEDVQLSQVAGDNLCGIQDTSVIPQLVSLHHRTKSGDVQRVALEVLICLKGPQSEDLLSLLTETLKSGVSYVSKSYAAYQIATYSFFEGVPALVQAAKDGDPIVQRAAIDALGILGERLPADKKSQVTAPLVHIMESATDRTVRGRAASSLGQAGDKTVVPALMKALDDPNLWVGADAANALARLGGLEAIPALQRYQSRAEQESQARAAREAILTIRHRIQPSR